MISWRCFNLTTMRMEEVDPEEMELVPGLRLVKMFWVPSTHRFVTIPGHSNYTVDANLNLMLDREDEEDAHAD